MKRNILIPKDLTQPEEYIIKEEISQKILKLKHNKIDVNFRLIKSLALYVFDFAQASQLLGIADKEILSAYRFYLHISSAIVQRHRTPPNESLSLTLPTFGFFEEPEVTFEVQGGPVNLIELTWPRAVYLSWILREDIGIQAVKGLPLKDLNSAGMGLIAPYVKRYKGMLLAYINDVSIDMFVELHQEFIDLLNSSQVDPEYAELAYDLGTQDADFANLLSINLHRARGLQDDPAKDEEAFQRIYLSALAKHKDYAENKCFEFEGRPNLLDPEFWVSLPLLGLASKAHDSGMQIDIDSDYAPLRWITGSVLKD